MTSPQPELRACPFCLKGKIDFVDFPDTQGNEYCAHECQYCGAQGPASANEEQSGQRWNTRPEPSQDDLRERVEAVLREMLLDGKQAPNGDFLIGAWADSVTGELDPGYTMKVKPEPSAEGPVFERLLLGRFPTREECAPVRWVRKEQLDRDERRIQCTSAGLLDAKTLTNLGYVQVRLVEVEQPEGVVHSCDMCGTRVFDDASCGMGRCYSCRMSVGNKKQPEGAGGEL